MGSLVGNKVVDYLKAMPDAHHELNPQSFQSRFSDYLSSSGKESIGKLRSSLRTIMTDRVSVFRTEDSISKAIAAIEDISDRALKTTISSSQLPMNQELLQRWELENLLLVAKSICYAAHHRKESRGAHFRDDYSRRLEEFNYHSLVSIDDDGDCHLSKRKIDMSLFEAGGEHAEKFDFIERSY